MRSALGRRPIGLLLGLLLAGCAAPASRLVVQPGVGKAELARAAARPAQASPPRRFRVTTGGASLAGRVVIPASLQATLVPPGGLSAEAYLTTPDEDETYAQSTPQGPQAIAAQVNPDGTFVLNGSVPTDAPTALHVILAGGHQLKALVLPDALRAGTGPDLAHPLVVDPASTMAFEAAFRYFLRTGATPFSPQGSVLSGASLQAYERIVDLTRSDVAPPDDAGLLWGEGETLLNQYLLRFDVDESAPAAALAGMWKDLTGTRPHALDVVLGSGRSDFEGFSQPPLELALDVPEEAAEGKGGWIYLTDSGNHLLRATNGLQAGSVDALLGTQNLPDHASLYWETQGLEGVAVARPGTTPNAGEASVDLSQPFGVAPDPMAGDPATPGDIAFTDALGDRVLYYAATAHACFGRAMLPGHVYCLAGDGQQSLRYQEQAAPGAGGQDDPNPHAVRLDAVGYAPQDGPLVLRPLHDNPVRYPTDPQVPRSPSRVSIPLGLDFDPATGDLYVAESLGKRVRKIARADGAVSTYLGAAQSLAWSDLIVIDADGNERLGAERVDADHLKLDPSGKAVAQARHETVAPAFVPPSALALEEPVALRWHGGKLYVVDRGAHRVLLVDPAGGVTVALGAGPVPDVDGVKQPILVTAGGSARENGLTPAEAVLDHPAGLAFDAQNRLVVSDAGHGRLRRVELVGGTPRVFTVAGAPERSFREGDSRWVNLGAPALLDLVGGQDLLVPDASGHLVRRLHATEAP